LILGEALQDQYRVRVANSGERALQAVATPPRPDVILLDVMMPGLDGYEVLRRLRADPATADIPVLFVTAMDGSANEEYGLKLGAVDYITKPINEAIVRARVKTQLELKAARDWLAAENHRLEVEVERRMTENRLIQDLSIRALATLAEMRDIETGHHILRTQRYVEILAQHLAARPEFRDALASPHRERIVKAAPLHDIGKVGIPDAILRKPGPLDPEEWAIMQTHAAIGAQAIDAAITQTLSGVDQSARAVVREAFAFLETAREIALHHHQKWDGSGYPGVPDPRRDPPLAGAAIPVAARLMALADVFDALMTRRVYKPPLSLTEATEIIVAGRGRHFDPTVVDAFLACREAFAAVAATLADPVAAPRDG